MEQKGTIKFISPSKNLGHSIIEQRGEIQLIVGPMFSGKSSELLRRIRRYTIANHKCVVVKYKADTRYSKDSMATHDQQLWEAKPAEKLSDVSDIFIEYDVIGIDEGQFFPDLVETCEQLASIGKIVVIAALDGTFERKPFGRVLELIPLAENVIKLNAVCMTCFADAPFSKRLTSESAEVVVGGADKYIAACRYCHALPYNGSPQKIPEKTTTTKTPSSPVKMSLDFSTLQI